MAPSQVWRKFYRALVVVTVRCTDTHCLDLINSANLVDDHMKGFYGSLHVVFYLIIALGLNSCSCLDVATAVHNTKHRVGTTEIQTNDVRLQ